MEGKEGSTKDGTKPKSTKPSKEIKNHQAEKQENTTTKRDASLRSPLEGNPEKNGRKTHTQKHSNKKMKQTLVIGKVHLDDLDVLDTLKML